jgi:uncharacterized protein YjlB
MPPPPPPAEMYYLRPTRFVPNSPLPVLLYRGVLGEVPTPASIRALIEPNHWMRGGQWTTYPTAHFHSVTHECYAIFHGTSTFRLGKSPLDPDTDDRGDPVGRDVVVARGDVIVLPVSPGGALVMATRGWESSVGLPVDSAIPGRCQPPLD